MAFMLSTLTKYTIFRDNYSFQTCYISLTRHISSTLFLFIIQKLYFMFCMCFCAPFVRLFCFLKINNNKKSCTNFMMFSFSQSFFFIADLMKLSVHETTTLHSIKVLLDVKNTLSILTIIS